jgi:hypothetical protein
MTATHILVDKDDLRQLQRQLGRRHTLCKRIKDALQDVDNPASAAYRAAATEQSSEGELEVDPGAVVSKGDDHGAYVMAWLWIADDELCSEPGGAS